MHGYDLYSYVKLLNLLNLSKHSLERYYERLPEEYHVKPKNIKRKVAVELADSLKKGCPIKAECIHLPFEDDYIAVIKPGICRWTIITFYEPYSKED